MTGGNMEPKHWTTKSISTRINMIKNTLAKKYADGDYSGTQLDEKLAELQKLKTENKWQWKDQL
jgi:hypothetical protein